MTDIVSVAISQIGVSESGKGHDKFIKWYGGFSSSTAWCAIFVSWCAEQAGVLGTHVPKYADCDEGLRWFKARGKYKKSKAYGGDYTPLRGDIIFFSRKYTQSDATHTGIVEKMEGSKIHTIEGNTSDSVARRKYSVDDRYVLGFGQTGLSNSDSSLAGKSGNKTITTTDQSASAPQTVEITSVANRSITGAPGAYKYKELKNNGIVLSRGCEILIQNDQIYMPTVVEKITLEYNRKSSPGSLKLTVLDDGKLGIQEGNPISFRVNGENVFYGYIFGRNRKEEHVWELTCYDQLRYLKNKDTLAYSNKKYSDLLRMIADDYGLTCGEIEDTGYVIPSRIEEATLFDILGNAADETVLNTGRLYVLYDDFGKLCLKNIQSMILPILIDKDTAGDYSYTSTIDKDVYNRIKIAYDNDTTGEREIYMANGTDNQSAWGILQYYDKAEDAETAKTKASVLLNYYNKKQRELVINNVFGDIRVRGGSSVVVMMDLGEIKLRNFMVVESVRHTFSNGEHFMNLSLSGVKGEFNV